MMLQIVVNGQQMGWQLSRSTNKCERTCVTWRRVLSAISNSKNCCSLSKQYDKLAQVPRVWSKSQRESTNFDDDNFRRILLVYLAKLSLWHCRHRFISVFYFYWIWFSLPTSQCIVIKQRIHYSIADCRESFSIPSNYNFNLWKFAILSYLTIC